MDGNSVKFMLESRLPKVQTLMMNARVMPAAVLAGFKSTTKPGKALKFENIRMRFYRKFKSTLRRYFDTKTLKIDGIARKDDFSCLIDEFLSFCNSNISAISQFAMKTSGPKVDHKNSNVTVAFTTYSNKYVESVLSNPTVARAYSLYVDIIFESLPIDQLVKFWKMKCCGSGKHEEECQRKWMKLKCAFLQEMEVYKNRSQVFIQVEGLLTTEATIVTR